MLGSKVTALCGATGHSDWSTLKMRPRTRDGTKDCATFPENVLGIRGVPNHGPKALLHEISDKRLSFDADMLKQAERAPTLRMASHGNHQQQCIQGVEPSVVSVDDHRPTRNISSPATETRCQRLK
jgi:hypothetical protein